MPQRELPWGATLLVHEFAALYVTLDIVELHLDYCFKMVHIRAMKSIKLMNSIFFFLLYTSIDNFHSPRELF